MLQNDEQTFEGGIPLFGSGLITHPHTRPWNFRRLNDELARLVALAIAPAVADQKGSGATFDIESMTIIDADSNRGWEVLPVAKAALKVIEPRDDIPQLLIGAPGTGKE